MRNQLLLEPYLGNYTPYVTTRIGAKGVQLRGIALMVGVIIMILKRVLRKKHRVHALGAEQWIIIPS